MLSAFKLSMGEKHLAVLENLLSKCSGGKNKVLLKDTQREVMIGITFFM